MARKAPVAPKTPEWSWSTVLTVDLLGTTNTLVKSQNGFEARAATASPLLYVSLLR